MTGVFDAKASQTVYDLAIFIKSYAPDFANVQRLLTSIATNNRDDIPIYICVPDSDVEKSKTFANVTIVPESFFDVELPTERIHGRTLGYLRQQIIKLSVHQLQVAKNYIILDSDAYIIRPFHKADFLHSSGACYTVLVEDLDQFASPWYRAYADRRRQALQQIANRIGYKGTRLKTCHGNVTFSADVLESFAQWCLDEKLTSSDLMEIGPYEFSWYNFYIQTKFPEQVFAIEPFIRYVHVKNEYRSFRYQGITIEELARSYVGICLNSNWTRGRDNKYLDGLSKQTAGFRLRGYRDLLERIVNGVLARITKR
mgnify:CR=1 FL=1